MADTIKIQLQDIYEPITQKDITEGKKYVLRREETANALASLIDALLDSAAERITKIAYRYGVDPQNFQITKKYNEAMFNDISDVLDQLEEQILDLTLAYSTKCTEDDDKKRLLLLWLATLGRNNKNLQQTLEDRLWMFSRDLEAMIAVAKTIKLDATKAVNTIKSYLHTAYQMPGMTAVFKNSALYKATYIRSRGIKPYNQGNSNSEANNIVRFGKITVQMGWSRYQLQEFKENGAAGFYQLRGSSYPCSICDDEVKFHPNIEDMLSKPYPHSSCMCYRVPVYEKDINEFMK